MEGIYERRLLHLCTERSGTVQAILIKLQRKKALQLYAPPFTGKTSLCQLVTEMAKRSPEGALPTRDFLLPTGLIWPKSVLDFVLISSESQALRASTS